MNPLPPNIPAEKIHAQTVERLSRSRPLLVSVGRALEAIPRMRPNMILHPGPPITWERMPPPLQGAVVCALLHEGVANSEEEAREMARRGRVLFEPALDHKAVCPLASVISPSMPVCIVRNETYSNYAHCLLNEGPGRVLRYGGFKAEALDRLRWVEKVLAPVLRQAIAASGGLDLRSILAQSLHMGDDGLQQTKASTSLFVRMLAPHLAHTCKNSDTLVQVLSFLDSHNLFFQNLALAAAKSALDAAHGIPTSRIVTAMAGNGVEFGIQVSGLADSWFTAPVEPPDGLFLPGYGRSDALPLIGDGSIMEAYGLGALALAGAPVVMAFLGGDARRGSQVTEEMYRISAAESPNYTIPALNMRGAPVGIDAARAAAERSAPWLNIEIINRQPGGGQIGAALWRAPLGPFEQAARAED